MPYFIYIFLYFLPLYFLFYLIFSLLFFFCFLFVSVFLSCFVAPYCINVYFWTSLFVCFNLFVFVWCCFFFMFYNQVTSFFNFSVVNYLYKVLYIFMCLLIYISIFTVYRFFSRFYVGWTLGFCFYLFSLSFSSIKSLFFFKFILYYTLFSSVFYCLFACFSLNIKILYFYILI